MRIYDRCCGPYTFSEMLNEKIAEGFRLDFMKEMLLHGEAKAFAAELIKGSITLIVWYPFTS